MLVWTIIFVFCAIAWAAGLNVLFRNRRASPFIASPTLGIRSGFSQECPEIEILLGDGIMRTFLFLIQITLDGGNFWDCASQSSYQVVERTPNTEPNSQLHAVSGTLET